MSWDRAHMFEGITLDQHYRRVRDDMDAFAEPEFREDERHWPAPPEYLEATDVRRNP